MTNEAQRSEESASTEKLDAFRAGAKAMFDGLMMYAANNYHGNPNTNDICQDENRAIERAAQVVFADISPDDSAEWKAVGDAYREGVEAGKRMASNKD